MTPKYATVTVLRRPMPEVCPRCDGEWTVWVDGEPRGAGSRLMYVDSDICGRCAEHEAMLVLNQRPLPGPEQWPLPKYLIEREMILAGPGWMEPHHITYEMLRQRARANKTTDRT